MVEGNLSTGYWFRTPYISIARDGTRTLRVHTVWVEGPRPEDVPPDIAPRAGFLRDNPGWTYPASSPVAPPSGALAPAPVSKYSLPMVTDAQRSALAAAASLAAKNAALAAKQAATVVAKARAKKLQDQAIAAAQKLSYYNLQKRQTEIARRANLIRDPIKPPPLPPKPQIGNRTTPVNPAAYSMTPRMVGGFLVYPKAPVRPNPQAIMISQQRARQAEIERVALKKRITTPPPRVPSKVSQGPTRPANKVPVNFNISEGKTLESALKVETERALKMKSVDKDYLEAIQKKYEAYAGKVFESYQKLAAKMDSYTKGGTFTEAARALYNTQGFQQTQAEFKRLYGSDGKNGAVGAFYKNWQIVGNAQRQWWKNQMSVSLRNEIKSGDGTTPESSAALKGFKSQYGAVTETKVGRTVDRYERYTKPNGEEGRRPVYRNRTMEEELDSQTARKVMEREKLVARRLEAEKRKKSTMIREGLVEYNGPATSFRGRTVNKSDIPIIEAGQRVADAKYGGKIPSFRNSEDLQKFVGELVDDWKMKHPLSAADRALRGRSAGAQAWEARRKAFEKSVYTLYGGKTPEWYETVLGAPGISHAMGILSGGSSTLGAVGRITGKAVTGSSTWNVDHLRYDNAPAALKAIEARIRRDYKGPLAGSAGTGVAALIDKARRDWIKTPEGKKWADVQNAAARKQSGEEDARFMEGFYGNDGALGQISKDPGAWLRALNEYGAEPFDDTGSNLLFGMLIDPSNAIPLNFTKWFARGKYAMEAAEGAGKLTKLPVAVRSFMLIDETGLKLRAPVAEGFAEMKKLGYTEQQLIDLTRREIGGSTDPEKIHSATERVLRAMGLKQQLIDSSQIVNLTEYMFTKEAKRGYRPLLTKTDELNAPVLKQIEKERLAAVAKQAKIDADKAKIKEGKRIQEQLAAEHAEAVRVERLGAQKAVRVETKAAVEASFKHEGVPVVARREIKAGTESIPARYDRKTKSIQIDEAVMKKTFEGKSWTKPVVHRDGSSLDGLPKDRFKTYEEYRSFTIDKEYQRSRNPRAVGENLSAYENRLNQIALGRAAPSPAAAVPTSVRAAPTLAAAVSTPRVSIGQRLREALPDRKHPYFPKDLKKFEDANKYIGRGAKGTSTDAYEKALGGVSKEFEAGDVVAISINGKKPGRLQFLNPDNPNQNSEAFAEFKAAFSARVEFRTDVPADRARDYNLGEREVAEHLIANNYYEYAPGKWRTDMPTLDVMFAQALGLPPPKPLYSTETPPPVELPKDFTDEIAAQDARKRAIDNERDDEWFSGGDEDSFVPSPTLTAVPELDSKLANMTEREWIQSQKDAANRVLFSKTASAVKKAEARERLEDIRKAERVIWRERKAWTYIGWEERASYQRKVLDRFGSEAEQMLAPVRVAPFVQSLGDANVEYGRTLWRQLVNANEEIAESDVFDIMIKGKKVDHIPKKVYDEIEKRVSAEINKARGYIADTATRAKGAGSELDDAKRPASAQVGRMSDSDPVVLAAKDRALKQYARDTGNIISTDAYDEARKVLQKGFLQNRVARFLLKKAQVEVKATGGDLEEAYLRLRSELALEEGRKQFGGLAFRDMYGHPPEDVLAEFIRRNSDDGTLKNVKPAYSMFQHRTLEEHVKTLSGKELLSGENVGIFLQSANKPPFGSSKMTREFLQRIGVWSPRKADQILAGSKSWSVFEESDYWMSAYHMVPPWTDPKRLATDFKEIFQSQDAYIAQHEAWEVLSSSDRLAAIAKGIGTKELDEASALLRRPIAEQRRYAIERFGVLVSEDGVHLDKMPWLMDPDEFRVYLAKTPIESLPPGFVKTSEELDELISFIEDAMKPFWAKYIGPKSFDEAISYDDIWKMTSELLSQLMANPKWARRTRDYFGDALNGWGKFQRWLVFSNPAFVVTNTVDAPIKGLYHRLTRRGLYNASAAASETYGPMALAKSNESWGLSVQPNIYKEKQAGALSRLLKPRGYNRVERAVDRALAAVDGTGEWAPAWTGHVELQMKKNLAIGMYPAYMEEAMKQTDNLDLADALVTKAINKEINKMWPSAGNGPIESLWNRIVPFASYSVRNKLLFISEALDHPAIFVDLERIGKYIEAENLARWEEDNPGTEMPAHLRRRISLPWAPEYYLDLSTFSDSSRGLKPLFGDQKKPKTVLDLTAEWVRLVNPGVQATAYAFMNAFNIGQKTQWIANLDDIGQADGTYRQVFVGWNEPWSDKQAHFGSGFWFAEAINKIPAASVGGWTPGEISEMIGAVFLFNGIETYDRGAVLSSLYYSLKEKNPEYAKLWLKSADGELVKSWWESRALKPRDVRDALADLSKPIDPRAWFHSQAPEFQQAVKDARADIDAIRILYADELDRLVPGTKEFREMKARMYLEINGVYRNNPELMMADVYGKSFSEFSKDQADWATDKLMDTYMNMKRPSRADFEGDKLGYEKATEDWEHARQTFLAQYPQVKQRLARGRTEISVVRDRMQEDWNKILGRVATRLEEIDSLKKLIESAGRDSVVGKRSQDRMNILYVQNEMDFDLLSKDNAASYWGSSDFENLPKGIQGPKTLRDGLISRVTLLKDFGAVQIDKAIREGRLDDFLANQEYGKDMKSAIDYAKRGDPFGEFDVDRWNSFMKANPSLQKKYFSENPEKARKFAAGAAYIEGMRSLWAKAGDDSAKWMELIKKNPKLLNEYFARNPGKKQEWAANDRYIKNISVWGKLVGAGKYDDAQKAWNALPKDVRDRYFKNNPGKREERAATEKYIKNISVWGKLIEAGRFDEAKIAFDAMPKDVRDRYFRTHPGKKEEWAKREADFQARQGKEWDELPQEFRDKYGKKFDRVPWDDLPQEFRDKYGKKFNDIPDNFNFQRAKSQQTVEYLAAMQQWVSKFEEPKGNAMKFFRELPEWIRERYYEKHPEKRVEYELQGDMQSKLANYFATEAQYQADYLAANPDLAAWLAKNGRQSGKQTFAIFAAYKAIPSNEPWLRRVFREKYPELFSQQAIGEKRLRNTYNLLARHPSFLPSFEKWVQAIWDAYAVNIASRPKPKGIDVQVDRKKRFGVKRSLSAAESSRYSR